MLEPRTFGNYITYISQILNQTVSENKFLRIIKFALRFNKIKYKIRRVIKTLYKTLKLTISESKFLKLY